MPLIKCEIVSLAYENVCVVRNLNFSLEQGDYLCIIGENGSGKSTLLKALVGLKRVKSGRIIYNGLKKTEIGYLPQQTQLQRDFPASVREVVLSGCIASAHPFYGKAARKTADENIDLLGLSELQNRCYRELSGGQQQRVLLARALCATKKLLVLDEPVNCLDPVAAAEMYEHIREINKNREITVIMVTHDVEKSLDDATHVLHMHGENPFFADKQHYLECDDCKHFLGEVHHCDGNH